MNEISKASNFSWHIDELNVFFIFITYVLQLVTDIVKQWRIIGKMTYYTPRMY